MNKNLAIIVVVIVVVVVALLFIFVWRGPQKIGAPTPGTPGTGSATRQSIASGTVAVPEVGAKDVPQNVAVPQNVLPAAQTGAAKLRTFSIRANNDEFSPDTVIVNLGDTVRLDLTAVDKNYDFFQPDYGLKNSSIGKGQTAHVAFQATAAGKFTFYCVSCGGPAKGPVGYLEVVAP